MADKNITIDDIAKALDVSKTTVSRAISGKGRIGEETKEKVLKFIEEHNYRPNVIAKSLAESKSYNIGFVMPKEFAITESSFYQKCLWGISQKAMELDYDVMVAMVSPEDLGQLDRIVTNRKVDGLILGRTSSINTIERFIESKDIPFVTVGSSVDSSVLQVDNDHEGACMDLTSRLIEQGVRNMALIGGDTKYIVNRNRYHGFIKAYENADLMVHNERIFTGCDTKEKIYESIDKCIELKVECIVCMDDAVCEIVINRLKELNINIPDDMMIASFYNSHVLLGNSVKITAINFDEVKLGEVSTDTLISQINNEGPLKKVLLGYEIDMRESTRSKMTVTS